MSKTNRHGVQGVINYYERLGSRLGYMLIMGRSQHFGYYISKEDSERAAQNNYHKKIAGAIGANKNHRVLDAGCGQGVVATHIARSSGCEVIGITIVPHETQSASKLAEKTNGRGTTTFKLMDYSKLEFPDDHFDAIYTTETLSHALDVRAVLRALCAV